VRRPSDNDREVTVLAAVELGREHYARSAWSDAHAALSVADGQAPLAAADLELLATAAYMIGRQTINRLRREATAGMGTRFDLKRYHDLLMTTGAVPLNVLEGVVRDWAAQTA